MRSRVRERVGAALLAFGLLAGACGGGAAQSGVNVRTVATDLVYGIPPSPKPAPPANVSPETVEPIGTVVQGGEEEGERQLPPQAPTDPCPAAPPTVFPPAAPARFAGVPQEGRYRWRVQGSQEVASVGTVRLPEFVQREVLDVGTTNGGPRFTIKERELIFGSQYTVFSTYEFRRGIAGPLGEAGEAGLYLVKVERHHASNSNANTEFNPSPPILVLPEPVVLGTSVDSTGIDPVSLEVLRQTGSVTKRERVDACGEPMDAFYVETFQDFVAADGRTDRRRFNYGIATVLGGLPIVEHIESPCIEESEGKCSEDARVFLMDAHIGQLEPD